MGGHTTVSHRKAWELRHPDRVKAHRKSYNNSEAGRAAKQRWKQQHPHYWSEYWQRLKERVFAAYGNSCARCGFSDKRALQLDHVQNDGFKHRIRSYTGKKHNQTWKAWQEADKVFQPLRFQILCANCNWIKRAEANPT